MMYKNYAKLRDSLGLCDAKVAELAGVSRAIFSRWKKGETSPSNSTRFKICKVLGIEPTMYFSDQTEQNLKSINKNEFIQSSPLDFVVTINGEKFVLEKKTYDELERAVQAYIALWIKNNLKKWFLCNAGKEKWVLRIFLCIYP